MGWGKTSCVTCYPTVLSYLLLLRIVRSSFIMLFIIIVHLVMLDFGIYVIAVNGLNQLFQRILPVEISRSIQI